MITTLKRQLQTDNIPNAIASKVERNTYALNRTYTETSSTKRNLNKTNYIIFFLLQI